MAKPKITDYFFYRYRFLFGYSLFGLVLVILLVLAAFIPGGLSAPERASVIHAMSTSASLGVNTPYLLLQHASVSLLGLHEYSVKLPSLLIGAASGILLLFLFKRWFSRSVAITAALLAVCSTQFLVLSQIGSPLIMLIFWPTLLIFAGTHIVQNSRGQFFYKGLFVVTLALSLYTPLSIYLLVIVIVLASLNPHARYAIKRMALWKLVLMFVVLAVLLVPFGWMLWRDPSAIFTLLALPSNVPSLHDLFAHARELLSLYGNFYHPGLGPISLVPVFGLASVGLMLLGFYQLIRDHYSARAYLLGAWVIALVVLSILTPALHVALFVPLILVMAIGLQSLLHRWYHLFPLNPYARVSVLLPIGVLLVGILYGDSFRYFETMQYTPTVASFYSEDLYTLNTYLAKHAATDTVLVAAPAEADFYRVLPSSYPHLRVQTYAPSPMSPIVIYTKAGSRAFDPASAHLLLVNDRSNGSVRFYVTGTSPSL